MPDLNDIKKEFVPISNKFDDIDTPLIKISIKEYEELSYLLEEWNGKKGKVQDKIKDIFFLSLKKSLIINSELKSLPSRGYQNSCLTLSSFIIAAIKDDIKLKNDNFYFVIDNISQIVSAIINSNRRSFKSNTFVHPNDSIQRLYEKKTLENISSITDLEYNFENVFIF